MTADVINRPLYKVLRTLAVPEDTALDAAAGFVTSDQLAELATKDDLEKLRLATKGDLESLRLATKGDLESLRQATKGDLENLRQATKADLESLKSRLTNRMVVVVGGLLLVLTQILPAGKVYEVVSKALGL